MPSEEIYQVPALKNGQVHQHEIIIKRSRFITSIAHTSSVEAAKKFIADVSAEHAGANHNCFAYNAVRPGSTAFCGCSDDGEPHGTAGQPMLNVVLHCGIGELTAVVTRYFGGILLGTGGLVKAYQDSVKQALQDLPVTERMIPAYVTCQLDHRTSGLIPRMLADFRAEILQQTYGATEVTTVVMLPHSRAQEWTAILSDRSKGRGKFVISEKCPELLS